MAGVSADGGGTKRGPNSLPSAGLAAQGGGDSWLDPPGPGGHAPAVAPSREPGEDAQEVLQGLVDVVTYHDEQNLFTVLRVLPEEGFEAPGGGDLFAPRRITAVGRAPDAPEGARVRLQGLSLIHI